MSKAIESRGDSISKSELKTVFFYMDTNKDGKISQDEMLQSKIALQYQEGTLGELPVIVKQAEEKKGAAWYGPVLVLLSVIFAAWYVFSGFKKVAPGNSNR